MVQLYQFPTRQRARARGCQVLSRNPQNRGFPLAAITLSDIGGCIHPHSWLVVALGMGLVSQSSTSWMVSAYSFMEFYQCILPLLGDKAFEI